MNKSNFSILSIFHRSLKLSSLIVLFLCSCAYQVQIKDANLQTPPQFKNQKQVGQNQKIANNFWQNLNQPQLNELIEKALKNNSDLKSAALRIEKDFSNAKIKWAEFFPDISANPNFQRIRESLNTGIPVGELIPQYRNLYTSSFDFSWELDLWGRIRNQYKAAKAQARGTYFNYLETRLSLVTEVIRDYFALQNNQLELDVLQQSLEARRAQNSLIQSRQQAGFSSRQESLGAENQVRILENELEFKKFERQRFLTSMAILINENPSLFENSFSALSPETQWLQIPSTLPSEWIRHRPDILTAEQNIIAANALTKSALAEFFPKFSFNAQFGLSSLSASNLLTQGSIYFNLGPQVSLPIFDAGKRLANYRAHKSEAKISLENYKKTVLTAFKDVEDHLAAYNDAHAEFENRKKIFSNAQKIQGLDQSLKNSGLLEQSKLLERQIATLNERLNLSASQLRLLQESAELIRSFGGGLEDEAFIPSKTSKN